MKSLFVQPTDEPIERARNASHSGARVNRFTQQANRAITSQKWSKWRAAEVHHGNMTGLLCKESGRECGVGGEGQAAVQTVKQKRTEKKQTKCSCRTSGNQQTKSRCLRGKLMLPHLNSCTYSQNKKTQQGAAEEVKIWSTCNVMYILSGLSGKQCTHGLQSVWTTLFIFWLICVCFVKLYIVFVIFV